VRPAAIIFGIVLLLISLYWMYGYIRRRARADSQGRRRP
jgi:hypothetical protein